MDITHGGSVFYFSLVLKKNEEYYKISSFDVLLLVCEEVKTIKI